MKATLLCAAIAALVTTLRAADGKPIALMGFKTDVLAIENEIMKPSRYSYEAFYNQWIDPADYGKYSVLYFGEKMDGEAKGKNFRPGENDAGRAALEKFIADGGTVIVGGEWCLRQLFGKVGRKTPPDPLRGRVVNIGRCLGRTKVNFAKAKKPLGIADDAGNFVVTAEGAEVQKLTKRYVEAFARAKGVKLIPLEGKWEAKPLGAPGTLKHETRFARRVAFRRPIVRQGGLALLKGGRKAVIVVPPDQRKDCLKLADELAWHLERMSGETFEIADREPDEGPALVYRTVRPGPEHAGRTAYMKIFREGDRVILGGEDAGKSRATTYVLEALGCRYLWPGESGKIIPRTKEIVLPEIAVEDSTSFFVRRMRLYGKPEWRDRPENRDYYRWYGLNDTNLMTTDKPGDADKYQWGHYYRDFYRKYYRDHRDWFALQPDGSRTLRLGSHPERPTFCLSNPELAAETARRVMEFIAAHPDKKAVSLCLPDGATSTPCMCEACRKLDPVNAAPGSVTKFFPERQRVPYVALTDRVFFFMNRVADIIGKAYPEMLLSCYAYGGYTAPPVAVKPRGNLIILSVAGYYSKYVGSEVEENLAAWLGFGNKVLWRPNAHGGFYIPVPHNLGRRMFDDISLMDANGVFGVDYDTMSGEWALKPLMYYAVCRAHFNPDRLDYDTIADDYCAKGFGAAAKPVRAYFDHLEKACATAARQNHDAPKPLTWEQRVAAACRLPLATDYDFLDRCLADARAAAGGDGAVAFRIGRLQFGADLGRRVLAWRQGKMDEAAKAAGRRFIADYLAKDPTAAALGKKGTDDWFK